ncbi:MAG: hypothetical protein KC619_29070 [Myxococcales bacterium]|nr:hypothetical protein [Myxococcales bacterium]
MTLTVTELAPQRVLELLGDGGRSHRVTIESSLGVITVELGNGLVVGAEADIAGTTLTGRQAYATIRDVAEGSVRIEPLRFPSLANILQPVAQLPDLERNATLPPTAGEDTIELTLPEARPIHPPPMPEPNTIEMELPTDAEELVAEELVAEELVATPRSSVPPPIPAPVATLPEDAPAPPIEAKPAKRRAGIVAAAAIALLAAGGTMGLLLPSSGEADRVAETAPVAVDAPAPDLGDEVDLDLSDEVPPAVSGDLAEARALARTTRRLLREGDRPGALQSARRAAALRGGMPYYQVLLGDALRANGQRAAALRAYRRAVRLRPGYGPAVRRLERGRTRRATPTSQT